MSTCKYCNQNIAPKILWMIMAFVMYTSQNYAIIVIQNGTDCFL